MTWGRGYNTDLHYLSSFFNAVAPNHLRIIQLLAGQRPPDTRTPFRCLEIGAGSGVGLGVIAASNPHAEFVAIDYSPGHIAAGAQFAKEAGLENLTLVEADIVDLAENAKAKIGEFDFVICHGVYSWVGSVVRDAILSLLRTVTKPGGLTYIGYNSLPGWSKVDPVQKMLYEFARRSTQGPEERILESFAMVQKLTQADAKSLDLDAVPILGRRAGGDLSELTRTDLRYIAHEYFSSEWSPSYHIDVAGRLAEIKFDYVGSALITDLFSEMVMTREQAKLVEVQPERMMKEQMKDFFSPQMYRRDIYSKGVNRISDYERGRRLKDEHVALCGPIDEFDYKVKCRIGEAELPRKNYQTAFEFLLDGPQAIGDLIDHLDKSNCSLSPEEATGILLATEKVVSIPDPDASATDATRQFNSAIATFALEDLSAHQLGIASPRMHNGLFMNRSDFVMIKIIAETGYDPSPMEFASTAARLFKEYNETLMEDEKPVTDPVRANEIFMDYAANHLPNKLRRWRHCGAF